MADNYPEGKSDYRAPLLTGTDNYNWWKGRMETYLSRDPLVLRVVQKGPYVFLDKDGKDKDVDDLTTDELIKFGYNGKARNSLMNGLNQAEHDKVSSLKSAKEMWDALETYHEGSKSLKKVKLSKLMNEFGNFKLKEGESIKESQARFQVNINALKRLGKKIPQDEINMKVLSAVPFIYEPKVTSLESSSNLDTMDHLAVFAELEQFETKILESKVESVRAPVEKMKNLALHSSSSKLVSDAESESDEELALMSRKIKKMIEKRNKLKKEKGKAFGARRESRDSKDDACFECGKKGHFKRDCYKLKNKPRQQAVSRDRMKSKALLTWSDDENSASDDESGDEMVNLALVGLDDEDTMRGITEDGLEESDASDLDDNSSEVNSINSDSNSSNHSLDELTLQRHSTISIVEFMELKNENNELEKKNASLRKMISELLDEKTPSNNHKDLISDLKGKLTQLEGFNKLLLKRNDTLMKELSELRAEIEARDVCLETFKIRESISIEATQQEEKIKELEAEVAKLEKGMGKFVQGEEVLKTIMK